LGEDGRGGARLDVLLADPFEARDAADDLLFVRRGEGEDRACVTRYSARGARFRG
jgi:hypothetical protein